MAGMPYLSAIVAEHDGLQLLPGESWLCCDRIDQLHNWQPVLRVPWIQVSGIGILQDVAADINWCFYPHEDSYDHMLLVLLLLLTAFMPRAPASTSDHWYKTKECAVGLLAAEKISSALLP